MVSEKAFDTERANEVDYRCGEEGKLSPHAPHILSTGMTERFFAVNRRT